ncbi:hypothetical protein [Criblamydia sequanensis]|nr:hypothetical protein [Criblamydia sequanensis]
MSKTLFLLSFLVFQSLSANPLAEQFKQLGYSEICNKEQGSETFDSLYAHFDEFIAFLQKNPSWAKKLYIAKERFIRSKERNYYSTDFFGFYDESEKEGRKQIAFYYSTHFHEFVCSRYKEFNEVPEITLFLDTCRNIQNPFGTLFQQAASEIGLETIFSSEYGEPPVLFKVIKYLPSYNVLRPHYDGTVFSFFLDSTDNQSLLLSPYKSLFTVDDFFSPIRVFPRETKKSSILIIPGTFLAEFSIFPTPHIVTKSGQTRYAAIAFAMRPNYTAQKNEFSLLPAFSH